MKLSVILFVVPIKVILVMIDIFDCWETMIVVRMAQMICACFGFFRLHPDGSLAHQRQGEICVRSRRNFNWLSVFWELNYNTIFQMLHVIQLELSFDPSLNF